MAYASNTSVSIEKTESEIKTMLRKHNAENLITFEGADMVQLAFEMGGRRIIFRLPIPDRNDEQFARTPGRHKLRSADARYQAWDQACRSRWRGLFLCIKAKLESVESGIETFEEAFLAHVMLPDGSTVAEQTKPKIAHAYESQTMQPLLPGPTGG